MYIELHDSSDEKITKRKIESVSKLIHIKHIDNMGLQLRNGKKLYVFRIEPINFNLKSQAEQNIIIESYKTFLRQCTFDFQIYIQTQKTNADKHIAELEKCIKYEAKISEMAMNYIELIREMSTARGSITRRFYIVVETRESNNDSEILTVIDELKACGNIISKCERNEIIKLFKGCFKSDYQTGVVLGNRKEC